MSKIPLIDTCEAIPNSYSNHVRSTPKVFQVYYFTLGTRIGDANLLYRLSSTVYVERPQRTDLEQIDATTSRNLEHLADVNSHFNERGLLP